MLAVASSHQRYKVNASSYDLLALLTNISEDFSRSFLNRFSLESLQALIDLPFASV